MIITDLDKIRVNQDSFCGDSSRIGSDVGISVVTDVSSTESESSSKNYTISPGVFESVDQGYQFYNTYARLDGFSVRKTTEKLDDADTVLLKHFVCSCEWFNNPKDDPKLLKKRRSVTRRCGCKAKMVLKYMVPNKYFVYCFVVHHNHPLTCEKGRHFLRSSREMTTSLRNICYNGAKDKSKSFYYAYDVDSDGRLTKLFWADSIGRRNFELYGDAISFDAIFDTNRYSLIFAPFTGVDKHDRCVTFASCLLSHESVADYSWAFGHLVKAMGRNHVLIIIDQCPAMKVSVRDVFSNVNGLVRSKHRLCMWHIMEKFPVKLGNRLYKETNFMEKMKTYIWLSIIETEEFESGCERGIKEFNLQNNKWLQDMYAIKASWIPAFFRNEPMFGLLRTTSRSESENSFFGQFHKQGDTLCEFWLRFESAMDKQMNETVRLDHESKSSLSTTLSKWFIEVH
ncbi:protein FAR1-RELATED SEQUENCE 5-like [Apium graveolens]|uniref:protein FAR1-RELATED SEQUENCE 5-like n=1 Tax=Apium graveolens TaxID=4045 RepID=UPI003D7B8F81